MAHATGATVEGAQTVLEVAHRGTHRSRSTERHQSQGRCRRCAIVRLDSTEHVAPYLPVRYLRVVEGIGHRVCVSWSARAAERSTIAACRCLVACPKHPGSTSAQASGRRAALSYRALRCRHFPMAGSPSTTKPPRDSRAFSTWSTRCSCPVRMATTSSSSRILNRRSSPSCRKESLARGGLNRSRRSVRTRWRS